MWIIAPEFKTGFTWLPYVMYEVKLGESDVHLGSKELEEGNHYQQIVVSINHKLIWVDEMTLNSCRTKFANIITGNYFQIIGICTI